jgi:hypothetical protein
MTEPDSHLPVILIRKEPQRNADELRAEYHKAKLRQTRTTAAVVLVFGLLGTAVMGYANVVIWQDGKIAPWIVLLFLSSVLATLVGVVGLITGTLPEGD